MGYMNKRPPRVQEQFYFSKPSRAGKEHGLCIVYIYLVSMK